MTSRHTDPHELLDKLDAFIDELDAAHADASAARLVVSDAEAEMAIIEASLTLDIEGKNETERKARLVLALRDDGGYQELARTARHARATLLDAERRVAVVKQRIGLMRAALALVAGGQDG